MISLIKRLLLVAAVFCAAFFIFIYYDTMSYYTAGFFEERVTPEDLKEKYIKQDIKILIVPGHDKEKYGAQYRGITESSLNTELGIQLFEFFRNDPKFTTFITHKSTGEFNGWISDYLTKEEPAINAFREKIKNVFGLALNAGQIKKERKIFHNPAADNTARTLYGINKWANDNNVDLVLHIHFNDYPGRPYDKPGKYKGFSIYVPERQLPNSRASIEIAKNIKENLEKIARPSNFHKEKGTIIEDQELIAIGSNASRNGASVLVEYGYIYEPKIADKNARRQMLADFAYQTYLGVKNFFEE